MAEGDVVGTGCYVGVTGTHPDDDRVLSGAQHQSRDLSS